MRADEDRSFWEDDGSGRIDAVVGPGRHHTGPRTSVSRGARTRPIGDRPGSTGPRGARRRAVVIGAATALVVPVAIGLGRGGGTEPVLREPVPEPVGAPVSTTPVSSLAVTTSIPSTVLGAGETSVATIATAPDTSVAGAAAASAAATVPATAAVAAKVGTSAVTTAPPTGSTLAVETGAIASEHAERQCVTIFYNVEPGDSWIGIAAKVQVTLAALLDVNGASASTPLYAGDTICLPWNAVLPATTTTTTSTVPTTVPASTSTTTTTVTKPTLTVPTSVPPGGYTRAQVEAIIRAVWPDDLEDRAVEIAVRESNLVPTAQNWCCYGLFQIYWEVHDVWLADLGITKASQLFDPLTNASAALELYERAGGWGPWE